MIIGSNRQTQSNAQDATTVTSGVASRCSDFASPLSARAASSVPSSVCELTAILTAIARPSTSLPCRSSMAFFCCSSSPTSTKP